MALTTRKAQRAALIAHLIKDHRFDYFGNDYTARLNGWSDDDLNAEHNAEHGNDDTNPSDHLDRMAI